MGAEWPVYQVSELEYQGKLLVQDGNHGEYRPRKSEFLDDGVAFIRAADFSSGAVNFHGAEKINLTALKRLRKGIGKDLDTVMSTKGTVGKIAFVPQGSPFYVCSPQTSFWRSLDHSFLLPEFLFYEMQSRQFVEQVGSRKGETDMAAYLSLTSQRSLYIRVPGIDVQKKVVAHASSLDKKIKINHKINQNLEQMAQALFKSWFVDFEPVKAKIAARQRWQALQPENEPASPVCYAAELDEQPAVGDLDTYMNRAAMQAISGKTTEQLDALRAEVPERYNELFETAALFSSAMQESELGAIPEGWDCLPLDSIAHYQNGLALQKYRPENEDDYLPVVKITQLKKGVADGEEKASPDIKPECIIDDGDVIFSWSGSLMVDIWCGGRAALNQHLFKVTSSSYPKWLYYHFTRHHLEEFQRIAESKAVTMGHIKREHLKQALCAIPYEPLLEAAGHQLGNQLGKQIILRLESKTLSNLRNTLLPKLLSGELTISSVEEARTEPQEAAHV
ncbi:hypothetical protein BTW08_05970 [Salinicola sp. MH3R3-1]|uniref:restriction endonuclease subunit S n=1 Tax=Salinicola sp. MH3R3-1 TaxID=1928762 RepID=UPI00094E0ED4|nr:restriction endonuclease subunit S [Salinicola sp. MH3R3-1]OLO08855.1 hypothetical protein BTW08_05970 [Salinicola sp. MH3R3-1]